MPTGMNGSSWDGGMLRQRDAQDGDVSWIRCCGGAAGTVMGDAAWGAAPWCLEDSTRLGNPTREPWGPIGLREPAAKSTIPGLHAFLTQQCHPVSGSARHRGTGGARHRAGWNRARNTQGWERGRLPHAEPGAPHVFVPSEMSRC